jgi:hypothetical protein
MFSGLPPIADIVQRGWHGRKVPDSDIHHTLFDHFVGVGKRLTRDRNRSSAREMLNARWQYCPRAHLFLPDRRHRGREIPVVEAPNRNAKLIWT